MPIFSNIVSEEQFKHFRSGFCDCLEELEISFMEEEEEKEVCCICEDTNEIKGYCDNGQCNNPVCIECDGITHIDYEFYCCEDCHISKREQDCICEVEEESDHEGEEYCECGEHYVDEEDMWKDFGDCKDCCSIKEYAEQMDITIEEAEKIAEDDIRMNVCYVCNMKNSEDTINRCKWDNCDDNICDKCVDRKCLTLEINNDILSFCNDSCKNHYKSKYKIMEECDIEEAEDEILECGFCGGNEHVGFAIGENGKEEIVCEHCDIDGDDYNGWGDKEEVDLKKMTVKELKSLCKSKGIKRYSRLRKQQLLDLLKL